MATITNVVARIRTRQHGSRGKLAWAAPVLVAAAVGVGAAVSVSSASGASPTLPSRTAAQLLTALQQHTGTPLSGTVTMTADLGIPSLPGAQSNASLSWQDFLTGSHSARVWIDGADRQRVALLGTLSEADVTHNGKDLWAYTSSDNTVSHTVLPTRHEPVNAPATADRTPAALAAQLLKAVNPSTKVIVDQASRVAGRSAYTLVLRPRDTRSTVREARIAIDAKTFVPLRVQLFGAGSTPALQVGFTAVSFTRPSASTFAFTRPAGATVTNDPYTSRGGKRDNRDHHRPASGATTAPARTARHAGATGMTHGTQVIGSGWTSVVEFSGGTQGLNVGSGLLNHLTTSTGTAGERLLHTALINAVIRPDGRVFAGAVSPTLLEHLAATTH